MCKSGYYIGLVIGMLLFSLVSFAQVEFRIIVPQRSVIVGESFQIQFAIEDDKELTGFKAPPFTNFRIVTGPNMYYGSVATINGIKPIKNAVYTLVAARPGHFVISPATAMFQGDPIRTHEVLLEVITREEAAKRLDRETGINGSGYMLRPGEDGYEKIKQNLFLKVQVDKKNCFVGEPVLATFKLYSRLESRSDIVKNPGFYGFTVYDMINLSDKFVTSEKINGKTFDVHTVRKVQLYPLQAGEFIIDAMEVRNKVEFTRSAINKKTEQEIVEGILGNNEDDSPDEGTEVFESEMRTAPVSIKVKPLPASPTTVDFNGAVGVYTIRSQVIKNELNKNEEGVFEVVVSGKGNFIQLNAPEVKWPAGIEGFEPGVKDMLDRSKIPLEGQRVFRFPFVASSPAVYTIPPIDLTFYNSDSGTYKTISTKAVQVKINAGSATVKKEGSLHSTTKTGSNRNILLAVLGLLSLSAAFIFYFRKKYAQKQEIADSKPQTTPIESYLKPVRAVSGEEKMFYSTLHQSIWEYFRDRLQLSGSEMSKNNLLVQIDKAGVNNETFLEVKRLIELCETGMFTNARLETDRDQLLDQTKNILGKIDECLL